MGTVALGIRNVLCVPLRLVRYVDAPKRSARSAASACSTSTAARRGRCSSNSTRAALETLAAEAAVAIENARLYRETMEKARMEQEMRIAAEIQQALLPKAGRSGVVLHGRGGVAARADRLAATSTTTSICRTASFGFALGDVAGKGPPAALLSAMMQGMFAAQAAGSDSPSRPISRVNLALYRRGIESRFVTLMYGVLQPDGRLTYCNAGHNPPLVVGTTGVRRLESGGPIVGLFESATLRRGNRHARRRRLADRLQRRRVRGVVGDGEEYGESRILTCVRKQPRTCEPQELLEALFADVREFAARRRAERRHHRHGAAVPDACRARTRASASPSRSGSCSRSCVWNGVYDLLVARGIKDVPVPAAPCTEAGLPARAVDRSASALDAAVRGSRAMAVDCSGPASLLARPACVTHAA